MGTTKGFITIATGKEEYYILARNLLRSYRHFCPEPLPFALLCDRENAYTTAFDDVLLFQDGASNSYLDKLALADYAPYDQTIFIDADCLAFGDLNSLFALFAQADDMSCFGRVLPLEDKTGWFEYENLGDWKEKVSYVVGLHGGIYAMKNTDLCRKVFDTARELVEDYEQFHFKGRFQTPGDEPLIALSMALNGCKPIPFSPGAICCYWEHTDHIRMDISEGRAEITRETPEKISLVHWGTRFTRGLLYQEQAELLDLLEETTPPGDRADQIKGCKHKYKRLMAAERKRIFWSRVKRKILRMMGRAL